MELTNHGLEMVSALRRELECLVGDVKKKIEIFGMELAN